MTEGEEAMRRISVLAMSTVLVLIGSTAAFACGGLIGPRGSVNLLRTTTLAGYAGGVEHYVTSFSFAGGGGAFGSIIPLPGIPTKVERGGDWTLQRLIRETQPQPEFAAAADSGGVRAARAAQVILQTRIDALDLTVLKGGGDEVGTWAKQNGFALPPDAPEVLDFYANRSPIFLAAKFDADAAAKRGQAIGDGTPIHLTIPTENPWVPLRILGLGKLAPEPIDADVYLLTEGRPAILPAGEAGLTIRQSNEASPSLISDLRADKGMGWIPETEMWLDYLKVSTTAGQLDYDLAVNVHGTAPSRIDAGFAPNDPIEANSDGIPPLVITAALGLLATAMLGTTLFVLASRKRA